MADSTTGTNGSEIAVISMSGRFPGAANIAEFWENLKNGIESIAFLSQQELAELDVDRELLENPDYVKTKGGVLEDKEYFDPVFFNYSPREAEIMDPQTRIFHECAWHALEEAGYNPENYDGLIGLYAGAGSSMWWESLTLLSGKCEALGIFASGHLNDKDFLSTQIAYKLNLKGPAFSVQTACSTSLVAIHLACQGILNGECDMALTGGIRVDARDNKGYIYQEGMIPSPDGHCRAFDAKAKGTIGGEGVGVVLLKPLQDALADGDHIYAVIKGTAINNDGLRKVGYTAPSIEGQAEAIRTAHRMAEIEPESIGYIEAHGTATELGDPVEIEALKLAFNTGKKNYCGIGSVKTNIGHLDAAAGVAGFIKTVLALNHQQLPPSLHFETPNHRIDFQNSPFFVNNRLTHWKTNGYPRRAGVSSFGIGGTNAHVILEEAPPEAPKTEGTRGLAPLSVEQPAKEDQLILLSAKTPAALDQVTKNLTQYLKDNKDISLADAAYTLAEKRKRLEFKRMAVCKDVNSTIEALSDPDSRTVQTLYSKNEERPVIFMFAGLGSQYVNMGRELYEKEPVFRDRMNRCFEILKFLFHEDIKDILYPRAGGVPKANASRIREFEIAQLVVFCFEYALTRLLMDWGVTPDAMIGYSFGEYVAAAVSGVFSLEDALKLVVSRGKLVGTRPHGAMLSVPMLKGELEPLLKDTLSIAIDNGPTCIVAGTGEDIKALEEQLKEKKFICFPMDSSYALHTKMMAPILPEFEQTAAGISIHKPQIPYISNLTGKWQTAGDAAKPSYWARHMGETVRFNDGIKELLKKENAFFIEIGPGRDLSTMVGRYFGNKADHHILNLVRPAEQDTPDLYYLLNKIGRLWLLGQRIVWQAIYAGQTKRRLPLPGYPFEKQRYWLDYNQVKHGLIIMEKKAMTQTPSNTVSHDEDPVIETGPDKMNFKFRPQLMNPYAPPRNRIEEDIVELWQDLFGFDRIGIDDNFTELGGSSLQAVNMAAQLKKNGAPVALQDVLANPTIRQLASLIGEMNKMEKLMVKLREEKLLGTLDCIEKLNNGQNEKNIFIIHPAHGMLVQYYDLARELENEFNVYGIQARGLIRGAKLPESHEELVDDYVEQVLKVQPNGPLILAGQCSGKMIAYQMTIRLEELGYSVEPLVIFNTDVFVSPQIAKRINWLDRLPGFVRKAAGAYYRRKFKKKKLERDLNEEEIGFDEVIEVDNVKGVNKRVYKNILFLCANWATVKIPKSPVLMIMDEAHNDHKKNPEDFCVLTKGKVTFADTTGDEFSIYKAPHVSHLAQVMSEHIRKTDII